MVLIPSMVQSGGGVPNVQLSPGMVVFGGRGGRGNEGRAQVDGLNTGASLNGGGVSGYRQDVENAAEIAITTAGGLGETEVGGPTINIVPRTGGNTFRSHVFFTGLQGGMQASNYTDELKAAGLRTPAKTNYIYDTSYSLGGPIKRDKIWFYFLGYYRGSENNIPGMFYNKNECDPSKWSYEADESRPALSGGRGPLQPALRLTFQVVAARQDQRVLGRAGQQQQPRRRARPPARPRPAAATTAGSACSRSSGPPPPRTGCCSTPASARISPTGTRANATPRTSRSRRTRDARWCRSTSSAPPRSRSTRSAAAARARRTAASPA